MKLIPNYRATLSTIVHLAFPSWARGSLARPEQFCRLKSIDPAIIASPSASATALASEDRSGNGPQARNSVPGGSKKKWTSGGDSAGRDLSLMRVSPSEVRSLGALRHAGPELRAMLGNSYLMVDTHGRNETRKLRLMLTTEVKTGTFVISNR
jgi:hypothetical protein